MIKPHLHTHEGAQRDKGRWGNPANALKWLLSQESPAHQWFIPTHMKEQRGTTAGRDTPKTSRRNEPSPWPLPREHQPCGPPVTPVKMNYPEHLSRSSAWGYRTLYRVQGNFISGLYKMYYGMFSGPNKSWERGRTSLLGKEEVWKLGRKEDKWG